jgi:hypothetical protein
VRLSRMVDTQVNLHDPAAGIRPDLHPQRGVLVEPEVTDLYGYLSFILRTCQVESRLLEAVYGDNENEARIWTQKSRYHGDSG